VPNKNNFKFFTYGSKNNNISQLGATLNNKASVLESFFQIFWHGRYAFFKFFWQTQK